MYLNLVPGDKASQMALKAGASWRQGVAGSALCV